MTQLRDEETTKERLTTSHHDFNKLWAAESISLFGSAITELALPLAAITVLNASALQMGLLRMFGEAPFLLFSLLAGVWLDRMRRRPVLISADVTRAILLLSIPIATLFHLLTLIQLYMVIFGVGTLTVVFEIAHYSYVPSVVSRARLVEGNSKLQISHSVADAGGPGIAGVLTQLISAPFAILVDAASYLISALFISAIHTPEPAQCAVPAAISLRQQISEGLRALFRHPLLRVIIVSSVLSAIFGTGVVSIYVLYLARDLGLTPSVIGLIMGIGGGAAVAGALLAKRVAAYIGVGNAIIIGWLLEGMARLLIPFAVGTGVILILLLAQILMGVSGTVANIHQWTFRQNIIPDHLLARVTASHRFLVYGAAAIGALLGGILGNMLGLRMALIICATGALLGPVYALSSPLGRLREQPSSSVD
jgi:Na+/melibiose symporter-like transporter